MGIASVRTGYLSRWEFGMVVQVMLVQCLHNAGCQVLAAFMLSTHNIGLFLCPVPLNSQKWAGRSPKYHTLLTFRDGGKSHYYYFN